MLTPLFDIPEGDAMLGASSALSEQVLLRALTQQLPAIEAAEKPFVGCRVVNALYQPSRALMLAVALLDDVAIPDDRLWPEGRIVYLQSPVRSPVSRRGKAIDILGQPFEAYVFPNDRRLRSLRNLAGSEDAQTFWRSLFSLPTDENAELKRQLLRYAPEQKFVARLRDRASNVEQQRDGVAVRICDAQRAAELVDRHKSARKLLKHRPRSLDVPRMIGGDAAAGIIAIEWIKGDGLLQTLAAGDATSVLALLAQSLHDFHQMAMPDLSAVTSSSLASMADAAASDLGMACPQLFPALASLLSRITARLRNVETVTPATIHNDFYFDQVRVRKHRCTIVDLERVATGDPLIDVANFVCQMRMLPYRPQFGVNACEANRWADLFLEKWQRTTSTTIDADRLAAYSAVSALVLARGMMRHLRPGWKTIVHHCIAQAESLLASTTENPVPRFA